LISFLYALNLSNCFENYDELASLLECFDPTVTLSFLNSG